MLASKETYIIYQMANNIMSTQFFLMSLGINNAKLKETTLTLVSICFQSKNLLNIKWQLEIWDMLIWLCTGAPHKTQRPQFHIVGSSFLLNKTIRCILPFQSA